MDKTAIFAAGLLPAIVIGVLGYRTLYKKTRLLSSKAILAVMLGVIAALPAFYIQQSASYNLDLRMDVWYHAVIVAFLVVSLVEELFKGLMLWLSNYIVPIDEPMDLLAISLLIAMGFAGVENVLYSYSKGWEVALFRSVTAVPAHACFALILAYFVTMEFPSRKKIIPYIQGLLLAFLLHGLYDFFVIQEISEPLMLGAIFILLINIFLGYNVYKRVRDHT